MADLDLYEVPEPRDDGASEGDGTRRFKAVFRALGMDEGAARRPIAIDGRLASRRAIGMTSVPPPPSELPLIAVGSSLSGAELVLRSEIGDGGMGVIFAASQRSLAREVAVKRLVPEATGDEAVAALVQEARVTGSLEHPSVVPVHALGADAHGRPVMVMRRVIGTPWGSLLRAPRGAEWGPSGHAIATHLEILLTVCNAVSFAHSRGVIHGDLKPDNVMLGAYGEVYVLDWGAALATRPDDPRGLRYAGDVRTVIGTPAYMAPEMIGAGAPISERTDVYLLGAALHEILTGSPPHAGASMYDLMKTAFVSRPHDYGSEVPRELAEICHRAMATEPGDRFADANELRRAIADHLEHRASIALGLEARARLAQLVAAIEEGERGEPGELQKLFAECRFGFQQAIRAWPGNTDAKDGLERAILVMVEHEVAAGGARAAALLATELEGPHEALRAKVRALGARVAAEGEELSRLRRIEQFAAARRRLIVITAAALGAIMTAVAALAEPGIVARAAICAAAGLLGLAIGAAITARRGLTREAASKGRPPAPRRDDAGSGVSVHDP